MDEKIDGLTDEALAAILYDAMREQNPRAMFWGEVDDDVLIDGHFDFRKVAEIFRHKLGKLHPPV